MDLKMAEDDNMWMRVACHCVVELVDEPLAFIRSHPDRMSRSIPLHVESVKQHMTLLKQRYPEVAARVRDLFPGQLAELQLRAGFHYFHEG